MKRPKVIAPKGDFIGFDSEEEYLRIGQNWGLLGKSTKHQFLYKEEGVQYTVKIAGYEIHGTHQTAVIEFENGELSCIHPAYLKEMQSPSFGKESFVEGEAGEAIPETKEKTDVPLAKKTAAPKKTKASAKDMEATISLPEGKVSFSAVVKGFDEIYNPFNEKNDPVVVYQDVVIRGEQEISLENAWSSLSKTLEKLELQESDKLTFEGKIVKKKGPGDVIYKINNPSKLVKNS